MSSINRAIALMVLVVLACAYLASADTVKPGDSCSTLAQTCKTNFDAFKQKNVGLCDGVLYPGSFYTC